MLKNKFQQKGSSLDSVRMKAIVLKKPTNGTVIIPSDIAIYPARLGARSGESVRYEPFRGDNS